MYLSELKLWNFRRFGVIGTGDFEQTSPGLIVHFHEGVNVIIGKNDSGKTAIIDAIRYVLHTKSGEHIYIDDKDFYKSSCGNRTNQMRIECIFRGLSARDAGLFLEYLSLENEDNDKKIQVLRITLSARRLEDGRIMVKTYAGEVGESNTLPYETREYLSAVYLKPLRDALLDMTHGYKSRLAQILQAHSVFGQNERDDAGKHKLEGEYAVLKKSIDEYFGKDENKGKEITDTINEILKNQFLLADDNKNAVIQLTGSELPDILKQLDLILEDNKSGLGSLNLLCMAAELLLFTEQTKGLKLTLIEELEAHIHPQLQLRLIDYFDREQNFGQFILTTHSITLGATIPLKKLIVMMNNKALPMDEESTLCTEQDYKFLNRFLDATKANLFFAKGLLLVEGDAENLLIPTIAKIIGRDLHRYGVSVVNIGSTAYKRYINIFKRKSGELFGMPISIVSDLDVRSIEYYNEQKDAKKVYHISEDIKKKLSENYNDDVNWTNIPNLFLSENDYEKYISENKKVERFKAGRKKEIIAIIEEDYSDITDFDIKYLREIKRNELQKRYNDEIRIFLPKCWTLEYDIARSTLFKKLALAIELAKYEMQDVNITNEILKKEKREIEKQYCSDITDEIAYKIFKPLNDGSVSKAITAQYLSELLTDADKGDIESDEYLDYIVKAIKHVTTE